MNAPHRLAGAALAAAVALALAPLAAHADESGRTIDGVHCERMEGTGFHIHQHLAIVDHGRPVLVPSDVGRPLTAQCFYWLHTHTPDGIIHVESPVAQTFTLGQFFDVWGVPLSRDRAASAHVRRGESMRVWVDGSPYGGNPRAIPLAQHTDITIDVGGPFRRPQRFAEWGNN